MGGRGGSGPASKQRMREDFDSLVFVQGQLGPEQQIQRGIKAIVANPNEFISLADLRAQLPDMARDQFDRTLRGMLDNHILISGIPQDYGPTLTERQRSVSLNYNGEDIHLIRVRR